MATIPVTRDTPTTFVDTANRAMTVTVDVTGVGFSVYVRLNERIEYKAQRGQSITFDIIKDDSVVARSAGTGNIIVTTT
jgi:hypothetical protein